MTGEELGVALALAAAVLLGICARRLRGTTLVAPALWALGSVLAIAVVEALAMLPGAASVQGIAPLRYAAAVTVVCPMIAVLGAKRPQDRAWQWVVLALLATLWLPAAQAWLLSGGDSLLLFSGWQAFLAILVLLGPLNYLPTRNWLASLFAAVGQSILLAPYFSVPWTGGARTVPLAMVCVLLALGLVYLRVWRLAARAADLPAGPLDDLNVTWTSFRDAFGAFWAIRVMQRVNQSVESMDSPVALTWPGWTGVRDTGSPHGGENQSLLDALQRSMRTVVRRFAKREEEG